MDRCAIAYEYHKAGFNCAQSVVGAFEDLTGLTREQLMAMTGGFGGGGRQSRRALRRRQRRRAGAEPAVPPDRGQRQGGQDADLRQGQGVPPPL